MGRSRGMFFDRVLGLGALLLIGTAPAAWAFTECAGRGGVATSLSTDRNDEPVDVNNVTGQFVCVEVTPGADLATGPLTVADNPLDILSSGGVELVIEAGSTIASQGSGGVTIENGDFGAYGFPVTDAPVVVQVDGSVSGQRGIRSVSAHSGEDRYTINGFLGGANGGLDVQHRSDEGTTTVTVGANGTLQGVNSLAVGSALSLAGQTFDGAGPPPRTGPQFTVNNNGTIATADSRNFAISVSDASATIRNAGTITGSLLFTDNGANTVENLSGATLDISRGGVEFRDPLTFGPNTGSNDLFRNSGTILSLGNGGFVGLDNFEMNGGVWRMDNGVVGDSFEALATLFTANGGEIRMDVALGGDNAVTDRLTFSGVELGSAATGLRFTNVGGLGAATDRGILVVESLNTSEAGAFFLANEAPLEVGAFVYDLTHNAEDNGFYLSSTGEIGSAATIYESAPALAFGSFGRMPTLAQRVGERQVGSGQDGFWLRLHGARGSATPSRSTAGASWDFSTSGLQVGYDRTLDDAGSGRLVLGVTAQVGRASADVTNAAGAGTIDMDGVGAGLTATWYHDSGFYLDGQLALNRVSSDFTTTAAGVLASGQDSTLTSFSVEAGRRFPLGTSGALVPQAQLTFGQLDGAVFTDASGNAVDLGSQDITTVRLGLAYEYRNPDQPGTTFYLIGNLLRDTSIETTVTVAGTPLTAANDRTWAEIGLGGTIAIDDRTTAYAEGSWRTASGNGDNDLVSLTVGFRMTW